MSLREVSSMNSFQISLKAARVNANMTQEDVAKALKRNKQTIVNWENGITGIHITDFKKLADLYKIPIEKLKIPERRER